MDTIELTFGVDPEQQERLIAELTDWGCYAFQQEQERVRAYMKAAVWSREKRAQLATWLAERGYTLEGEGRTIPDTDWNQRWEETVEPVSVGPFLVRPSWADATPAQPRKTVLEIDPKMSFGTGAHASTRLVLRWTADLVQSDHRVLEAGTGTGILAIAAAKQAAREVIAFDTNQWAAENAPENFQQNGVSDVVTFRAGSLEVVPERGFDVILANINRVVLLDMLPGFAERLAPGGRVALSGLLHSDRSVMLEAAAQQGFSLEREATEEDWWAVVLARE